MEQKFYICEVCGNIVEKVKNSGVPVVCCGKPMTELVAGTTDASVEKHVPVVVQDGNTVTVTVGSVIHPMTEEHYIEWIVLKTKNGVQRVNLSPNQEPKAVFVLADGDSVEECLAYCNLHSLWKA